MMASQPFLNIHNGSCVSLKEIPKLDMSTFRDMALDNVKNGGRIASFFGIPSLNGVRLIFVSAHNADGSLRIISTDVTDGWYRALTPECPQAHWFEREIAEQWGIVPQEHPWLKPIRFHRSYIPGNEAWERTGPVLPGATDFFHVEGSQVHEVAVGPVHAGIIEPGHFRFQCHGEQVFHLEISLGYQHRGVERALIGGPDKRTIHYMETLAGDTSVGHATAYCHAVESLSRCRVPARAQAIRGIALELERLANHTGDLGALANDVAYLPTASYCGRLRGDFLNLTALLCGNRFGRGLIRPSGAGFDLDKARSSNLLATLDKVAKDVSSAVNLLWNSSSVMDRFEGTGLVTKELCETLGIVGVAARASGLEHDARFNFPIGIYQFTHIPICTYSTADVFARAYVRWLEIQQSLDFIKTQLNSLPEGDIIENKLHPLAPESLAVTLVEGWRGEICHVAITDAQGQFSQYKIVDPSFHNWIALAMALRGEQISNFPLCNKSFNLSYCGHDL